MEETKIRTMKIKNLQKSLEPYDKKYIELLTILPRRFILKKNQNLKFEYFFDGKWCSEEEIRNNVYGNILNLLAEEEKMNDMILEMIKEGD